MKRRAVAGRGVGVREMPAALLEPAAVAQAEVSLQWLKSCAHRSTAVPGGVEHSWLRTAGLCTLMWKVPETHRKCEEFGAHQERGCWDRECCGGAASPPHAAYDRTQDEIAGI